MRVAILIPNYVGFDSGAWVVRRQAEGLAAEGHYVAIFTLAADLTAPGADLFVMGMPRASFWEKVYRLLFPLDLLKTARWLPRLKGFDVVIVHLYPLTWLGYLAKKVYGVCYTLWYHGIMDPQCFPRLYERVYIRLHILGTRLTVRNADRAVAVSRYAAGELTRYTGLESEVVYNRVELEGFHPGIDGTEVRERHCLGDDPVILFVGMLRPVKGVSLLIEAFNLVREQIPGARLLIVGRPDYPYYFEELKRMGNGAVTFAGFVPREKLPAYYCTSDLYATCTLWETFNIPIVEAQACGTPVVAFDLGPHPEVVDQCGVLVEPRDIEGFARACVDTLKRVRGTG